MSERPEERELTAVESALRSLRPQPEVLDRAALMYRAGRASARGWRWPMATVLASALALALGISLTIRPSPPTIERVVYRPAPAAENRGESADVRPVTPPVSGIGRGSWSDYVHLQEEVLDRGLDGLPAPAAPEQPQSVESLLRSL